MLDAQDELADRWHGVGLLRFSYTLRTIFNCSDELVAGTMERARALGTVVQMHVAEVPEENTHALATRGATTVRHLDRLGALGPDLLAVHATWVDDEEIGLLADATARSRTTPRPTSRSSAPRASPTCWTRACASGSARTAPRPTTG
ncbi:hypothetical protein BJF78_21585 [Pseudonocardia sp. CNS-139]|nr:hypothetical protein BJF78_21585 [Pseudonocardia sp. CNS-139]